MSKVTKLVPNGIYKKEVGERRIFATCINATQEKGVIRGTLSIFGQKDEQVVEGQDYLNSWTRVRRMRRDPIDLVELMSDIGDAIEAGTKVVLEGIDAVDTIKDAVEDVKKSVGKK